ncbi:MAG: hypothetical protein HON23_05470 [Rickettsiales bacterium]|jgi:hypothetical protein|nr:hypothetical protein [Rickettsiales bacterium]
MKTKIGQNKGVSIDQKVDYDLSQSGRQSHVDGGGMKSAIDDIDQGTRNGLTGVTLSNGSQAQSTPEPTTAINQEQQQENSQER